MKRAGRSCLLAACLLLAVLLAVSGVYADTSDEYTTYDTGYYIKDYRVEVTVNTDRTYDITETLTVHFNEPRHGIKRNIPTWASLEREVRLENVSVEGAEYEYDGYGTIKIGSADRTVTGDMQYVINYTLWHYADEEPEADYVYLNLIGTEWDTYTEHYSCFVHLPEGAGIQDVTLTGGGYGSTDSISEYRLDTATNTIEVFSDRGLNAYEGVTINIALDEGTFSDAEVWFPELEFIKHDTTLSLDEYGVLRGHTDVIVKVNRPAYYMLSLRDIHGDATVSGVSSVVYGPYGNTQQSDSTYVYVDLDTYVGRTVRFSYNYEKQYTVRDGQKELNLKIELYSGSGERIPCPFSTTVSLPFAADSIKIYDSDYSSYERQDYTLSVDGQNATVLIDPYRNNSQDAVMNIYIADGSFRRDLPAGSWSAPFWGLAALAIAFFASLVKPKWRFNPVPLFYPPAGITPPEAGYILKNSLSERDMTSMIYYWASKKLLSITFEGKSDFTLNRTGRDEDYDFKSFEKPMFQGLWRKKSPDRATDDDLSKRYYKKIENGRESLIDSYGGKDSLIDRGSAIAAQVLTRWMPMAFLALTTFMSYGRMNEDDKYNAVLSLIICLLFVNGLYKGQKRRWMDQKKRGLVLEILYWLWTAFRILAIGGFTAVSLGGYTMSTFSAFVMALLVGCCPLMYGTLARRSDYGYSLLENVEGFRMFLETAEKERLKMLLDENPEYYYDILPYAQVLGITKQWTKRFDGLTLREPAWLDNRSGHVFTYSDLSHINNSFSSSMMSRPASSGGGGGFSSGGGGGGGGSFSSGGFSGGGSGGGGGSSW